MEVSWVNEREKEPVCPCVVWSRTEFPGQALAATRLFLPVSAPHPFFLQLLAVQTHCRYCIPLSLFLLPL